MKAAHNLSVGGAHLEISSDRVTQFTQTVSDGVPKYPGVILKVLAAIP